MINLNERELEAYKVTVAMQTFGGSFVKKIAELLLCADIFNISKIKATWPEYWQEYLGKYEFIKDKYPINEATNGEETEQKENHREIGRHH